MAVLNPKVTFHFEELNHLARVMPALGGRLLALIGKRGRDLLKQNFLSGQEITLRAWPKDKLGRPTIISDVKKTRREVKIYSYPVNLFERKRRLRDGSSQQGKFIITKKLKQAVTSRLASYVADFERRILIPELPK